MGQRAVTVLCCQRLPRSRSHIAVKVFLAVFWGGHKSRASRKHLGAALSADFPKIAISDKVSWLCVLTATSFRVKSSLLQSPPLHITVFKIAIKYPVAPSVFITFSQLDTVRDTFRSVCTTTIHRIPATPLPTQCRAQLSLT